MINYGNAKLTFKQFARKHLVRYLEDLFDNPSKHIPDFDDLTHRQQEEVLPT